jgi:hypothetical protein
VQTQTILKGETTEFPFVLLDSKTKLGKAEVLPATIIILVSKAGGPLVPVTNPVISGRGLGLYYWTPKPADTDTVGNLVYFATVAGCDDWRDMYTVTEAPPPVAVAEVAATLEQILAGLSHAQDSEMGRIAGQNRQLAGVASGEPQAAAE